MTTHDKNLRQWSGRWWQTTLDHLLPPRCVLCGLPSGPICICPACESDLPRPGPHCHRCGLPVASAHDRICGACVTKTPVFTRTVFPLQYNFPVDRLVQAFKFRRQLAAGRVLSHLICEHVSGGHMSYPDMLVPVPLHNLRMMKRGFNQASEMSNYIGRKLGVPTRATSLMRKRNTRAQSGLSRKERRKNVRGAFYWRGMALTYGHVALIDDVMTTGTTVTECARVLKRAGAKRVDIWVAARAVPGPGHRQVSSSCARIAQRS